ncbi:MAG: NADH:flavin oxidoreductase/NADH oxidase [Deltaproteobacteria bacterium]|nr:NADH:flavin oxidoreductase/NADH oxidase [Deltaproteobacteria bacterium]
MSTPPLFTPITLGDLTLPNRIVIAPMCQYSAREGVVGNWHHIHLGNLSHSGAGLLIAEATGVTPEGRITPACPGLWNEGQEQAWGSLVSMLREFSAMPLAIQLAHAGRKASTAKPWEGGKQVPLDQGGWETEAPSPLPFQAGERTPHPLDAAGLKRVREAFGQAAGRAHRAGFDAVEVHAAHGYLLNEFLSPVTNQRTDAYGGSRENRMRFVLEVFEAVRQGFPSPKPVGIRVSASDWMDGGWGVDDTVVLAQALKDRGCAYMHVSGGGLDPKQTVPKLEPGYMVAYARRVKEETGLAVMAVGMITQPDHANQIIAQGHADMAALARGMLYNPRWPWHAAAQLGAQVSAPPQLWRATKPGLFLG